MAVPRLTPWPRTGTVREDWLAWLPPGKEQVFDATQEELEIGNAILGVILNDAFTLCQQGKLRTAREQTVVFAGLFERLADRLSDILRALDDHGRRFRTAANVVPLSAAFFRNPSAQRVARTNALLSVAVLRARARFLRKLGAIGDVIADLRKQQRDIVEDVAQGTSLHLPERWTLLEVLHYDLNTCLRETTIVLKSFFCVLPDEELAPFRKRLFSLVPAIALRSRRSAQVVGRLVPARRPPAVRRPQPDDGSSAERGKGIRTGESLADNRDNSRSRGSIPPSRMRPDGTGGPNETN